MKKADWEARRDSYASQMQDAASKADSGLKELFGPIAWGRFDGERRAANDDLANVVFGCGYLAGARAVLLAIARRDGLKGLRELEGVRP